MAQTFYVSVRTLEPYVEWNDTKHTIRNQPQDASRADIAAKRAIEGYVRLLAPRGWKRLEVIVSR